MIVRSALRATVRARCKEAEDGCPPGRMNVVSDVSLESISSIHVSNCVVASSEKPVF